LLCVRIMGVLRDWDPKIYNSFTQIEDDEMSEKVMPLPLFVSH